MEKLNLLNDPKPYNEEEDFNNDFDYHKNEGVVMCDTFLSHLELLQSLIISKSLPNNFSFKDFSDPHKTR